jgi:hypothetical protein
VFKPRTLMLGLVLSDPWLTSVLKDKNANMATEAL